MGGAAGFADATGGATRPPASLEDSPCLGLRVYWVSGLGFGGLSGLGFGVLGFIGFGVWGLGVYRV